MEFRPAYLDLYESGKLEERIAAAYKILEDCVLCPRQCHVNRLKGEKGTCKVGKNPIISNVGPHFGEEAPLIGHGGSGTIFLTNCNLHCIFCQNYDISHLGHGREVNLETLADSMLYLQKIGCHNINFVTPTHQVPQIIGALSLAIKKGLNLPLVYNTGGYDAVETLKLLEGIFDIYMPDIKYADTEAAKKYSNAPDYPQAVQAAVKEMYRQVGDLAVDERGIAQKGLLVRHLVMPHKLAGTAKVMRFLAKEISRNTYVNIMDQYWPEYKAGNFPEINRRITQEEYHQAINLALKEGLSRGFPH